jgi:cardiolipin synthase A/B
VRLLVPNATDLPLLKPLSRSGYRPLLEAGVRIFEWNGTMLHAKTAVVDGHWARVGSTNLNLMSWFNNYEMDIVVENEQFARGMEEMYLNDLTNATEIVLDAKRRVRAPGVPRKKYPVMTSGGGTTGRAAAGVVRLGNAVGSAFTGRRVLNSAEDRLMAGIGGLLLLAAILVTVFPRALSYPSAFIFIWLGVALLYRGYKSHRKHKRKTKKDAHDHSG